MSSVTSRDVQQPGARIIVDSQALIDFLVEVLTEVRNDQDYQMTLSESSYAFTTYVLDMFGLEYTIEDEAAIIPTGVVPADYSYVASLEIKKADEELAKSEEVCSVCLEGWNVGDDVKYSPCKHCFHPACVDKWFNINHFCPLCRFELPVAKDV